MDHFANNVEIIKKHTPILYQNAIEKDSLFQFDEVNTSEIHVINNGKKITLFSLENKEYHYELMSENIDESTTAIVIFGYVELPYFLFLKNKFPQLNRIIYIEPSKELFQLWMKRNDITQLSMSSIDCTFIVNQPIETCADEINSILFNSLRIGYTSNLAYRQLFNEYINSIESNLVRLIRVVKVNYQTATTSSDLWLVNAISNTRFHALDFSAVKDFFRNKPVIVVGAGPSLNKNMHLLPLLYDKAIIVAAGSAITILSKNNIKPHFNLAYDGMPREMKILEGANMDEIPLIFGSQLYYKVLENHHGERISMNLSSDYVSKYLFNKAELPFYEATTAPSIVVVAANMFASIGAKSVILMGQDMCYKEDARYASGANADVEAVLETRIKATDIFGEEVYTTNTFISFKFTFEQVAKKYLDTKIYNATEGGIGIPGIPNITLQELMHEALTESIDYDYEYYKKNVENTTFYEKAENVFQNLVLELNQIDQINNERLKWIKNVKLNLESHKYKSNRLLSDSKYVEKFEPELMQISFYKEVISKKLDFTLKVFRDRYAYHGTDVRLQVESFCNIMNAICMEIRKYTFVAAGVIKERGDWIESETNQH